METIPDAQGVGKESPAQAPADSAVCSGTTQDTAHGRAATAQVRKGVRRYQGHPHVRR